MRATLLVVAVCLPLAAETKLPPPAEIKVDFEKHVRPILAQKCHSCHGEEAQQSGLRLDRRQNAMRGGDYGPVIIPGKSAESKLIRRLVSGDGGMQMPPTGPLSAEEIGILRAWIDQGADFRIEIKDEAPSKPVDPKVTAAISVVRSGDTRAVEKLVAGDPEIVKARDQAGSTLLHHAASFAPLATVRLLLDKGADVNAKNRRSSTPLHWGIHDEAKVRLLIARGASIDMKQVDGRTPLYQAASIGNGHSVLRLLLDKGADPALATANGQTPLMAAAGRGDVEAMLMLIEKNANVNARNGAGASALMGAAASGNPRAVQLLLDKGADPNIINKRDESPLANAATAGVEESVKLLLDRGAKVNVRDDRGYSPLMYAAGSDALPAGAVKLLLASGADLNCTGENETARSLAVKRGDTEVAKLVGVPDAERRQAAMEPAADGSAPRYSISVSVQKALALLEKQSHNFIRIGGCNSCHAQDLPSAAAALARDRGLPAPREIPQISNAMAASSPERVMDLGAVNVTSAGWELFDLGMNHAPRDQYTDAVAHYMRVMQTAEGNWKTSESRRPPMNAGAFQAAALAIYAMKHYAPPAEKADTEKAIARAAAWLEKAHPQTSQDRAFHLLGLAWANAAPAAERAARVLADMQRADGGWNQLPGMASDAYATGQALYALNTAGKIPPTAPVYQKGIRYLLSTQAADGSWYVPSRSIWIQPYFESGFPYGHDQWISAAGTGWAVMALSLASDSPRISRNIARK